MSRPGVWFLNALWCLALACWAYRVHQVEQTMRERCVCEERP